MSGVLEGKHVLYMSCEAGWPVQAGGEVEAPKFEQDTRGALLLLLAKPARRGHICRLLTSYQRQARRFEQPR